MPSSAEPLASARYLDFPHHLQLQTHSRCNMACRMCPHPALDRNKDPRVMPWEAFTRLIDECLAAPEFQSIVLDLQNEPLLDPHLVERVRYIRERAAGRPVFIGMTSNVLALTAARFGELVAAGVDRIVLSLNALDAPTFSALVPKVRFARILDNVQEVLALPGAVGKVKLSFGASRVNMEQVSAFIRHAETQGIPYRVFAFHDRLKTIGGDFLPLPAQGTCHLPLYSMAVLLDGTAILCCQDWERRRTLGNVLEDGVRAVWQSADYRAIRAGVIERRALPDSPCKGCDAPQRVDHVADFNARQMQRMGVRFFGSPAAQAHDTFQVVPLRGGFALYNAHAGGLRAVPAGSARALEHVIDGTEAPDEVTDDALREAREILRHEQARPARTVARGLPFRFRVGGEAVEAILEMRSGAVLRSRSRLPLASVWAGRTAEGEFPVAGGTVAIPVSGRVTSVEGDIVEIALDATSAQAVDACEDAC